MNYPVHVSEADVERIRSIPHFRNSIYRDLDIVGTLDFFARRYVQPLARWFDLTSAVVVDCGAGYGWFSFAFVLSGGSKAIAADIDANRLAAARDIARVLSVDDRMEFIVSPVQSIPLTTNEVDLSVSIETLEHVGRRNIRTALQRIKEVASQGVLITTPNKLFPIIAHDTRLPFAHWLPTGIKMKYAKALGREDTNDNNDFLSPLDMNALLSKFKPVSKCLTFQSYEEYRDHYPFYLPYGPNEKARVRARPSGVMSVYYKIASALFGRYSYWVMPSLAHIFVRR